MLRRSSIMRRGHIADVAMDGAVCNNITLAEFSFESIEGGMR